MSVRPIRDRVVVRRAEEEPTSAGGIVLPGAAAEKPNIGEVVAVGDGRVLSSGEKAPMQVKVADKVLFDKYAGTAINIDGEELLVMREQEIIAVIEG